ncbi:TPA: hypothetical protein DEW05_04290 [Candidatus Saccharibacteria bacterium]|nr:hypothetical protein [Candidatus Saccharibacteria bacterium]
MRVKLLANCGNSPRSQLVADLAVSLHAGEYSKVEPWLANDFQWVTAGSDTGISREQLQRQLSESNQASVTIDMLEIRTAFGHGKYAAVSSVAHMSNDTMVYSHDLYEFTGAGKTAKLLTLTSYIVDKL